MGCRGGASDFDGRASSISSTSVISWNSNLFKSLHIDGSDSEHHELMHLEVEEENEKELDRWSLSIDSVRRNMVSSSRSLSSLM